MEYVFSVVKEFEGIIGALLGVVVTMLMNEYLKAKGRLKYYFTDFSINHMGVDDVGTYRCFDKESDYTSIEYEFKFQIYNTSESKKILRDIKIQFISDELEIRVVPKDSSTRRGYAGGFTCDSIGVINLNPKEILEMKVEGYIGSQDTDIKKLKNIEKIYMVAKDSDDKIVKKLIVNYTKTS